MKENKKDDGGRVVMVKLRLVDKLSNTTFLFLAD